MDADFRPDRAKGIKLNLRTAEREVAHMRQELWGKARATIRFETPSGRRLLIGFGERRELIGGARVKAFLFIARPAIPAYACSSVRGEGG